MIALTMLLSISFVGSLHAQTVIPTDTPVVLIVTATPVLTATPDPVTVAAEYAELSYQMQYTATVFVIVILGLMYLRGQR